LFIFSKGYISCYKPIRFSCCIALHKFPCMGLFKLVAHYNTINPKLTPVRVGIIYIFKLSTLKLCFSLLVKIKSWSHIEALVNMFVFPLIFVSLDNILSHSNLYGHPHFHFFFLFSVVGIEKMWVGHYIGELANLLSLCNYGMWPPLALIWLFFVHLILSYGNRFPYFYKMVK
jgi:hypothetical protein